MSKLQNFRRAFIPQQSIDVYRSYLKRHFLRQQSQTAISAALVDHER